MFKSFVYCLLGFFIIVAGCTLWRGKRFESDEGDLIFSHKRHFTINIPCEDCHIRIDQSELASDNNIPKELTCMGSGHCHKRTQGCELCHQDVSRAVEIIPKQHRVIFSHKAHLNLNEEQLAGTLLPPNKWGEKLKPDCITCHRVMKESINVSDDYWPRMKVCQQCHEINAETCTTCHLSLGEETFAPISHDSTWLNRHKQESQFNDQLCDVCHRGKIRPTAPALESGEMEESARHPAFEEHLKPNAARFCADCHRGDIWPEDVHDNNYLYSHGIDALAGIMTCTTCHQREECLSCHENGGITFVQSHPRGWVFNHSTEARRQLNSCINCHEEEDCLGCHQAVNPHPENWDREITSQNEQVCSKCH